MCACVGGYGCGCEYYNYVCMCVFVFVIIVSTCDFILQTLIYVDLLEHYSIFFKFLQLSQICAFIMTI